MRLKSHSTEDTIEVGRKLGRALKRGDTVCLYGDLGAGKTTLIKGIAESLGIPARDITSQSFTIIAEHEGVLGQGGRIPFYHIDLYRLESESDIEGCGVYEYIGGDGISVIEWAERLNYEPFSIKVTLHTVAIEEREILIEGVEFTP